MASRKNFRQRRTSDSSSSESEREDQPTDAKEKKEGSEKPTSGVDIKGKIEELKFIQKQRQRTHGIDVYSLAIGEQDSTGSAPEPNNDNDPWKLKTGGLVDMRRIKEKRGNEIVKNMHSNFAKETNQRDEDAEMQKFIEEQLRAKKEAEKRQKASESGEGAGGGESTSPLDAVGKFKRPEDALFDVPKYLIENKSKHKSEESLSEQMLSGIPEVDLGVDERIRNIEETERAKQQRMAAAAAAATAAQHSRKRGGGADASSLDPNSQYAPHNTSVNFVQHKRFDDALINPDHMIKPRMPRPNTAQAHAQPVVVVGDAPKHELLQQSSVAAGSSMATKRFQSNNSRTNPNARRKFYVSTNEAAANVDATVTVTTGDKTATAAAEPAVAGHKSGGHKRHHGSNPAGSTGVVEKASDDYCLERFKKNMRFSRNSKIKIC